MGFFQRPTLRTRDDKRTTAAELTLRASIYPLCLVTILFFLWYVWHSTALHTAHTAHHFAAHCAFFLFSACYYQDTRSRRPHRGFSYGLIDTLNKHFQETLGITRARSSGLQAAYFGAYPLASLGHANWLLRHWGYKAVFIWGLCLYGVGALLTWPALVYQSFGGFCAATFVIGNGLGSLETAANPYLTVCKRML
jgi:FHS family L-fucose permease-like MFS transporter